MEKEERKFYRYHIILWFNDIENRFYHCFDSNSEILRMSEIRKEISNHGTNKMKSSKGFHIENVVKTCNDYPINKTN